MIQFLQKVSLFKGLPDDELLKISTILKTRKYRKDEVVFKENDTGKTVYIVQSGIFRLFMGGQKVIDFYPGDFFGELALINENLRSGEVTSLEDGELLEARGKELVENSELMPETSLNIIRALARRVTSYLRPQKFIRTSELIHMGESDLLEFKSSLRYNHYTKKYGKEIEHAALKSIAAFLNTKGGTLLIGVADDGNVPGIDDDKFENDDKALLHLSRLVSDRISNTHNAFLKAAVENEGDKKIIRVDVQPSTIPAYLRDGNEEHLYIRTGPATVDLRASEIFLYVYNRFFIDLAKKDQS